MLRQNLIINTWLLHLVGFLSLSLSLHNFLTMHGHRNLKELLSCAHSRAIAVHSKFCYSSGFDIPESAWSKTQVCGRSLAGIAGSNPAGGMDVFILWLLCVVRKKGLCDRPVNRPKESYGVWCVWIRSWSLDNEEALANEGCWVIKKKLFFNGTGEGFKSYHYGQMETNRFRKERNIRDLFLTDQCVSGRVRRGDTKMQNNVGQATIVDTTCHSITQHFILYTIKNSTFSGRHVSNFIRSSSSIFQCIVEYRKHLGSHNALKYSSWICLPRGPKDDLINVETCRPDNILFLLYIK